MDLILTIVLTLLIFGVLIAIHELGHYLVARLFKVGIREYSIGMGPKILQKQGKYNKFTLRVLPIGGYVDMVGESSDDDGSDPEDAGKAPLNTKPIWQRILIVLAGPAMNILLGLLIMAILVLFQSNIYGTVIEEFGAANVSGRNMVYVTQDGNGFEKGDIIFAVDGKLATADDGIESFVKNNSASAQVIVVRRNSQSILNDISFEGVTLSDLPLSYDGEKGYFTLSEDKDGFKAGDIIYTLNGTKIIGTKFADGKDAAENISGLLSTYKNKCTVGVVRDYQVFIEPETVTVELDSFSGMPLYVKDGLLKLSEDYKGISKNGVIIGVNGEEIDPAKHTPQSFEDTYGSLKGSLTVKYNWYVKLRNPMVINNVDLSTLSLAVSGALEEGDEIYKVGSYRTRVYTDMSYGVFNEGIQPTDVTVIRNGKKTTVNNVVFYKISEQGILCGAVDFNTAEEAKTFGTVCYNAMFQPISSLTMTVDSVLQTFTGKYGIEALSGPVGIGEQVGQAIKAESGGGEYLFTLMVLISLSLGICNLLPLPVLDGGRFVLYVVEGIRRKPLSPKVEQIIMGISWVLVMGLMVFVMFKDIIGLF